MLRFNHRCGEFSRLPLVATCAAASDEKGLMFDSCP
jgi:hypothetical protein